jgi:hypothetical protein
MDIQKGQHSDVCKALGFIKTSDCSIIAEGGNDRGDTFFGSFLVQIKRKGVYRFDDGKLVKKVK